MKLLLFFVLFTFLFLSKFYVAEITAAEKLEKANVYKKGSDPSQYLVSEKLDGVWARWNGKKLVFKSGLAVSAPTWFVEKFPDITLEGELWVGRGGYQETIRIVRDRTPSEGWRKVRFMVFDSSTTPGDFQTRHRIYSKHIQKANSPYLKAIRQFMPKDEDELYRMLDSVIEDGGEGLMLHLKTALYRTGRGNNVLKLKKFLDSEAKVIGYKSGKGKFLGMVGSLMVEWKDGIIFYIGSGLNNETRRNPPPLGSLVTFQYQGLTERGIPRFPVYLRVREK